MASYLRPRRGTLSAASAIVLKKGEVFFEFKGDPATTSGGTSCGALKMGNGTTTYNSLGYFLNPTTDVVTWASTTEAGLPSDWDTYGGASATSASQGADLYADLNALTSGAQNLKVLPLIKNLLYKLCTQVTKLNNERVISEDKRYIQGYDSSIVSQLPDYNRTDVTNFTSIHIDKITVKIGGGLYQFEDQTISVSGSLGQNFYVYANTDGTITTTTTKSANSNSATLIGGFHYGRVRRSTSTSDVVVGIVPNSVWTLKWRPSCFNPDAMVYLGRSLWGDIYLTRSKANASSGNGGEVYDSSAYGATPATGSEGYNQFTFVENLGRVGKRPASYHEFVHAANGSPQGLDNSNANAWSATTNNGRATCGTVANAISSLNIVDLVGNVWKWTIDMIVRMDGTGGTNGWFWYTMNQDSKGQMYACNNIELVALLCGGHWSDGSLVGSRSVHLSHYPWDVRGSIGCWAVAPSI